ncbi:MAG: serine/threonine protein kinase [Deltaproteobacteria bacterium]|nr:serine/threonine protein kinase [Deltaproteobacteria bacterium]
MTDTRPWVDKLPHGHEETVLLPEVKGPARAIQAAAPIVRGTCIGRYVVLDVLGKGGMGVVYKAHDPELDRSVALKLVNVGPHEEGTTKSKYRARLIREAQALAQLSHPNVIAVYDVGTFGDDVFVAMELVKGPSLNAWLKSSPPLREVLDKFIAAGRGLRAAHRAGLMHRDFKPSNVIVGEDGRVRVLDFGLARPLAARVGKRDDASHGEASSPPPSESDADSEDSARGSTPFVTHRAGGGDPMLGESSDGDSPLAAALTATGAVLGTPAFMAPEQHDGGTVDERSDQFSFCVALYQALYRQHPFASERTVELKRKARKGKVAPPPEGSRVPARLRRILLRGLSPKPEQRFPSMDELLGELAVDTSARTRRVVTLATMVVLAGLATHGLVGRQDGKAYLCKGAEARLQGTWDDQVRAAARQRFLATGKPYAAETWRRVEGILGDHARAWVAAYTDACEATHVRGEQSEQLLDLKVSCLTRRLAKMRALVELFAAGKVTALEEAIEAALRLGSVKACQDRDALLALVPPPEDPATRSLVASLQGDLDRASALEGTGNFQEGLRLTKGLVAEAKKAGYSPLTAEALYTLGLFQNYAGDLAPAEASYLEGIQAAAQGRDDRLAAQAWVKLVRLVGYEQARAQEGLAFSSAAESAVVRMGGDPLLSAELLHNKSLVSYSHGKYDEARKLREEALNLRLKELPADHLDIATSYNHLAMVLTEEGKYKEAEGYHRQALEIRAKALGPEHPLVADSRNNLGAVLYHAGRYEEAKVHYERALTIRERALGPEHRDVATTLNNLGGLYQDLGKTKEARLAYERALATWEKALGPTHPDLAIVLFNLGDLANQQGEHGSALDYCNRALGIEEGTRGAEHPDLAFDLTCMGEAEVGNSRPVSAVSLLERALGLRKARGIAPEDLAKTEFALARALWEAKRERRRAVELAKQAAARFRAAGEHHDKEATAVVGWLAGKTF